jgi:hypothetical protein
VELEKNQGAERDIDVIDHRVGNLLIFFLVKVVFM